MNKENLVLVHSFGTNSTILEGLGQYMDQYFQVQFIDLPGFAPDIPLLNKISYQNYTQYVRGQLAELNASDYILGGISFGFAVGNEAIDERCKGVLAIEPYLGPDSLRLNPLKRLGFQSLLGAVNTFGLAGWIWKHQFAVQAVTPPGKREREIFLDQIDPKTYFQTAGLLLGQKPDLHFHNLPYILMSNPQDRTVNYDYIRKAFSRGVEDLLELPINLDHYPEVMSADYFRTRVPAEYLERIIAWVNNERT